LVVPLLITITSLAYWSQIAGARSSVVLVPSGILILIAIFLVIVIVQDQRSPSQAPAFSIEDIAPPIQLLGLCVLYYLAIDNIGFHLSNLVFSFAASLLMGLRPWKALLAAVISTAVLYGLALVMNFNVPDPFWAR
jgi:hypothetical protein